MGEMQAHINLLNQLYGTHMTVTSNNFKRDNTLCVADFTLNRFCSNLDREALEKFASDLAEKGREVEGTFRVKVLIDDLIGGYVTYFNIEDFEKTIEFITKLPIKIEELSKIRLLGENFEGNGFIREFYNIKVKQISSNINNDGNYLYKVAFIE